MRNFIKLIHGDCLEKLLDLDDSSIDLVLTDLPYGTTNCKWDSIIPFDLMWKQINRVAKKNAAIVMTASQPFTTKLISSNMKDFKYTWVWEKPHAKGHFNAKKRPMVAHEDVVVFYRGQPVYNPQMTHGHERKTATRHKDLNSEVYHNNTKTVSYDSTSRYPRSVQVFKQDTQKSSLHPTQKPLGMMEYFVKTYSNEGQVVLDLAMGSGTTGLACKNTGRGFVGIEKELDHFTVAKERLL